MVISVSFPQSPIHGYAYDMRLAIRKSKDVFLSLKFPTLTNEQSRQARRFLNSFGTLSIFMFLNVYSPQGLDAKLDSGIAIGRSEIQQETGASFRFQQIDKLTPI